MNKNYSIKKLILFKNINLSRNCINQFLNETILFIMQFNI